MGGRFPRSLPPPRRIENVGENGRPLRIQPHTRQKHGGHDLHHEGDFRQGTRQGQRAFRYYPNAKKLVVRDLAALLVDEAGRIKDDEWDCLVDSGAVSGLRTRKDGSLISFEFGGKRVRLATLKHFITHQQQPQRKEKPCLPHPSNLTTAAARYHRRVPAQSRLRRQGTWPPSTLQPPDPAPSL
jgi:hypothetical protein